MTKNLIKQLAITGLAVVAVGGVAVAASAATNGRQDTAVGSSSGGPDPAVPSNASPGNAVPGAATPAPPSNAPTPAPPKVTAGAWTKVAPPAQPRERPLPKDAVVACEKLLAEAADKPGKSAKVAARLDGVPGTVLVLADGNHWAGCSTAYARQNGQGSLREPAKLAAPAGSKADAFAVANNIIPMKGKEYEYYWAAGLLPDGVARIAYTFPDGTTTPAAIQGKYWLLQHRSAKPWVQGGDPDRPKIKVTLSRANGSVVKTFSLTWGEQTCAQITHGC